MQWREKRETPEKTRRPVASSGRIPTSRNPGRPRQEIEPGSPGWEFIVLTLRGRVSVNETELFHILEKRQTSRDDSWTFLSQMLLQQVVSVPWVALARIVSLVNRHGHKFTVRSSAPDLVVQYLTRIWSPSSVRFMSRQSQCSRVLQAPSRTVGFTRRFHTLSSIQATNTSLAVVPQSPVVVHTSLRSRTLGQAASIKDCRPLGCGTAVCIHGVPRRGIRRPRAHRSRKRGGEVGLRLRRRIAAALNIVKAARSDCIVFPTTRKQQYCNEGSTRALMVVCLQAITTGRSCSTHLRDYTTCCARRTESLRIAGTDMSLPMETMLADAMSHSTLTTFVLIRSQSAAYWSLYSTNSTTTLRPALTSGMLKFTRSISARVIITGRPSSDDLENYASLRAVAVCQCSLRGNPPQLETADFTSQCSCSSLALLTRALSGSEAPFCTLQLLRPDHRLLELPRHRSAILRNKETIHELQRPAQENEQRTAKINETKYLYTPTQTSFVSSQPLCWFGHLRKQAGLIILRTQRGCSRVFAHGNRAGRCHWSVSRFGVLPLPQSLHPGAAQYSTRFTLIDSQELLVKRRPNISTTPIPFPKQLGSWRIYSPMRVIEVSIWSGAGMRGRGKREIPEKTRRPTASSGTIPTCEIPVARPGIEPGSPWWEASVLIAQPPCPLQTRRREGTMRTDLRHPEQHAQSSDAKVHHLGRYMIQYSHRRKTFHKADVVEKIFTAQLNEVVHCLTPSRWDD
ncbi:hypothetical protein PR048_016714 [Dryococelus australis]|uniref:Uncharacterized protein n=1 Tax=Dryococelus australis TaxID=614101 RepID=A0ABQ9H7H0_9NEOP|nr:hypothetical protein PR048_016714 [Dryococelus australis]